MNNLQDFKTFYLDIALPNLPSFTSWFNESNFDKNIAELIKIFEVAYNINPFDISDPNEIVDILKNKDEAFVLYSSKKGSGVPNTLLNTHYFNFLKYKDQSEFNDLQDFVNKLNIAFGNFTKTFQKERIKFNGNKKVASNSVIFGDVRDDYWTINKGSEKELQYHIFKDKNRLGYGLGFNAQKSMNNLSPIEMVSKFISAFIQNKNLFVSSLKDYEFINHSLEDLINIEEGDFILFGKTFSFALDNNHFILEKYNFLNIYYDLRYRQFTAYKRIYKDAILNPLPINQIIQKNIMKELLHYKKQIILQGPPGTGKTREAKKIAEELIGNNSKAFDLKQYFKVGQKINSTSGIASYYDVLEVHANKITIKNEKAVENREISLEAINDTISQINTGQVDKSRVNYAYESALASYIIKEVKSNDQIKLIQFHPSYTYEDFVRGIVSKPNDDGDGIMYEAENKLLADFAQKAFDNYIESNKTDDVVREETSVFDAFIESIKDELAQNKNHKYDITEAVYLFSADETRFKYKGDNWVAHSKGLNMKFSELKKIIDLGATERQDIKKMTEVEELTRQHATYFIKIVEKYYDFKKTFKESVPTHAKTELKNYVLIIDEINRANLSSVLGELIYALEYRGEVVESMYAVGNDSKLILPPNLYIIGTMNTADRSVGHIDYAIRRRFAFVDVLPKDLTSELKADFMIDYFEKVTSLFLKNYNPELDYNEDSTLIGKSEYLTNDFDPKDVWLGHSYFIKQYEKDENGKNIEDKPIDFELRIKYEIKPILEEYVKDGILKESAKEVINSL